MTAASLRQIVKHYGETAALKGVDFEIHARAVNVLIGENGAGKSTLMRILAGIEQPSSGEITINGKQVSLSSVHAASDHGIGIVHQELNFCPNLTVAENIFLKSPHSKGHVLLDKTSEYELARAVLARLEQDIDPLAAMGSLRIGQQQIVEIAKALTENCRILILDEPTSALSTSEVEVLFRIIEELKRSGVAIVYISHRLEELLRIGDYITVLRDGRLVDHDRAENVSLPWIVERMLGQEGQIERVRKDVPQGDVMLSLRNVTVQTPHGAALHDISAGFRSGEITAIYGLLGTGRTELLEVICGIRDLDEGSIELAGHPLDDLSIAERVHAGVLLVPEDRQKEGLFGNLSVGGNLGLANLPDFLRWGAISLRKEWASVRDMIARLGIKTASADISVNALSGGNQQKVVIGRSLMPGPSAILLDEPSRGVDVGARAEIFETMEELAQAGLAVVFTTSDVLEAIAIADRIIVMANGRISADVKAMQANQQDLVAAANNSAQQYEATIN